MLRPLRGSFRDADGELLGDTVGRTAGVHLVQCCCAGDLGCSRRHRVSPNSAEHVPVGRRAAEGSR